MLLSSSRALDRQGHKSSRKTRDDGRGFDTLNEVPRPAGEAGPTAANFESDRAAENSHRHLCLELRRVERRALSGGPAVKSLARILCPLFPGSRDRLDFL